MKFWKTLTLNLSKLIFFCLLTIENVNRCDVLIVIGSNSSFVKQTEAMHKQANLERTSLIKLENVGDVMIECPEKVSEAILFFLQVAFRTIIIFDFVP